MVRRIPDIKILLKLTKMELADRIISLSIKQRDLTLKIKELEGVIIERNKKILLQESTIKLLQDKKHEERVLGQYEDLLRDYRIEISDLKDEIEDWKERYVNK